MSFLAHISCICIRLLVTWSTAKRRKQLFPSRSHHHHHPHHVRALKNHFRSFHQVLPNTSQGCGESKCREAAEHHWSLSFSLGARVAHDCTNPTGREDCSTKTRLEFLSAPILKRRCLPRDVRTKKDVYICSQALQWSPALLSLKTKKQQAFLFYFPCIFSRAKHNLTF